MTQETQKQNTTASQTKEHEQRAVPYIPPPPPNESLQRFKSPMVNGLLLAVAILFGGFMTYNFVGHQLTQLSGATDIREESPTPSATPSVTESPTPTVSY